MDEGEGGIIWDAWVFLETEERWAGPGNLLKSELHMFYFSLLSEKGGLPPLLLLAQPINPPEPTSS